MEKDDAGMGKARVGEERECGSGKVHG